MSIHRSIHKFRIGTQPKEFVYWQSRTYEERLRALEDIRLEYNGWKYHDQQGLQRVYQIVKRRGGPLLEGLSFSDCYPARVTVSIENLDIDFIDLAHLRKNKAATGRTQDLADLEHLSGEDDGKWNVSPNRHYHEHTVDEFTAKLKQAGSILDVKGMLSRFDSQLQAFSYWRL